MKTTRRVSGVTLLAAAVLVLLPALAWLQYSWLNQVADADRDRRARTLQTAAVQLTQDFDSELGKASFGLQLDPSTVEQRNWPAFASRYQVWADSALSPRIVKAVYFAEAPAQTAGAHADVPALHVWRPELHTFEAIGWPDDLKDIRTRFEHDAFAVFESPGSGRRDRQSEPRGERPRGDRDEGRRDERGNRPPLSRMLLPPLPTGDDQSIMMPVVRVTAAPPGSDRAGTDVKLLGFTIVRFDLAVLASDVLPTLVRRHLYDRDGDTEFAIAVVSREEPTRVVYESSEGAAAMAAAQPDVTASLFGPRMGTFLMMARGDVRRWAAAGPPPPGTDVVIDMVEARRGAERGAAVVQRTTFGGDGGHWRLVVKHRAGSLEAAVAAARTRNFALSSGILALLAVAIGLLVVSARRADRLARQQLEFVAAVSHELRTPVSVIGAAAGNLADGVVDEPGRVKRYGATIQTEARRLAETVERVLQLAGIAAGRAAASPALVPGHVLINEALAAMRHDIDAAGVTVERHLPDALPSVSGDAMALRSALQNLIGNAVKYAGTARWVRISAGVHGRTLRIAIEDRGLGISADDRKHVFEPFYRGREAVARQIQGSGLGLHLVRRVVEAHGGTVAVTSEPGAGSTFTVELPVADEPAPVESPGALSPRPTH